MATFQDSQSGREFSVNGNTKVVFAGEPDRWVLSTYKYIGNDSLPEGTSAKAELPNGEHLSRCRASAIDIGEWAFVYDAQMGAWWLSKRTA